jgi:hypothetical protein
MSLGMNFPFRFRTVAGAAKFHSGVVPVPGFRPPLSALRHKNIGARTCAGVCFRQANVEGAMFFQIGDFLVGMLVGVLTALAVRVLMWPGIDMVIAMLIGMGVGMVIHFVIAFALGPLLGMFQTMIPASVIGMYGGMFFGMRDSMEAGSATYGAAALVGAIFGAVVVAALKVYDRALHGATLDLGA